MSGLGESFLGVRRLQMYLAHVNYCLPDLNIDEKLIDFSHDPSEEATGKIVDFCLTYKPEIFYRKVFFIKKNSDSLLRDKESQVFEISSVPRLALYKIVKIGTSTYKILNVLVHTTEWIQGWYYKPLESEILKMEKKKKNESQNNISSSRTQPTQQKQQVQTQTKTKKASGEEEYDEEDVEDGEDEQQQGNGEYEYIYYYEGEEPLLPESKTKQPSTRPISQSQGVGIEPEDEESESEETPEEEQTDETQLLAQHEREVRDRINRERREKQAQRDRQKDQRRILENHKQLIVSSPPMLVTIIFYFLFLLGGILLIMHTAEITRSASQSRYIPIYTVTQIQSEITELNNRISSTRIQSYANAAQNVPSMTAASFLVYYFDSVQWVVASVFFSSSFFIWALASLGV
ncbi:MAG: hypothetical protein EZS28_011578 [Streblomastix strix]|uniref:Uncharacterized protein n=1 Tax=Streblomastix strix TaxID=222440 RepID=A0A5J4WD53_9EUKA|nr:MAG: hypothetical protein EZS28_011578 [Streblomastix strix]